MISIGYSLPIRELMLLVAEPVIVPISFFSLSSDQGVNATVLDTFASR
jgi:hypothetical protein